MFQQLSNMFRFRSPRLRRASTYLSAAAAISSIQQLETRDLMAADLGNTLWQSGPLGLDDIRGAASNGAEVRIVGQDAGSAAEQRIGIPINLGTTLNPDAVQLFWSLSQTANGGGTGFAGGVIQEVVYQNGGKVLRVGDSQTGGEFDHNGTYWLESTLAGPSGRGGSLISATPIAVFAGTDENTALVGSPTQPVRNLPNATPGQGIADMTPDATYLAGSQIWRATNVATLSYVQVDTSSWTVPENTLGLPSLWRHVAKTTDGVYFAGEVIDIDTFGSRVGIWRENGTLVGVTDIGDTLADMTVVEGALVLSVNGTSGGAVYLPTTTGNSAGLGARIDLSSRLGVTDDTIVPDTTFASELGMVVRTGGVNKAVSFELLTAPEATQVNAVVHQLLYPANVLSTRQSIFEVGLQGSSTFDVRKIAINSLFVGDERNSATGKVLSVRFVDTNRDGHRDAIFLVQTKGAIQSDTSRLRISGTTAAGEKFDGSRNVTVTNLTWLQYWRQNSGSWLNDYRNYLRTTFRTWW